MPLPYGAEKEAWPTWESITASASAPSNANAAATAGTGAGAGTSSAASLAHLVSNLTQPVVSADEAREYTTWLSQFRALASLAPGSSTRIADADAALYTEQAELAAGEPACVARLMAGVGGAEEDAPGATDAALLAYAVAAQALANGQHNFQPSEAKLRAYSRWLAG